MPALNQDASFYCHFSTTDSSYDTVGIQRNVNVTCALTSMAEVFTLALSELMQRCLLGWVIPASVDESLILSLAVAFLCASVYVLGSLEHRVTARSCCLCYIAGLKEPLGEKSEQTFEGLSAIS